MRICLPPDYMKFELPEDGTTNVVSIGVDIKDIPKVSDLLIYSNGRIVE